MDASDEGETIGRTEGSRQAKLETARLMLHEPDYCCPCYYCPRCRHCRGIKFVLHF